MLCTIWYHLYNLKNVKNTHGGVLLLVKLQALKVTLFHGCFSGFLNYKNDTKSRKASHIKKPSLIHSCSFEFFERCKGNQCKSL